MPSWKELKRFVKETAGNYTKKPIIIFIESLMITGIFDIQKYLKGPVKFMETYGRKY